MKGKGTVCILLLALCICLATVGTAPAETIKWRVQSAFSRGDFSADLLPGFAKEVMEKSGGRLEISVFYAGDLVPADDTFKATGQGIIQMSQACGALWAGQEPILGLEFGVPFGYKGSLDEIVALIEKTGLKDMWAAAYDKHNCHLLGIHTYGPYPAIASNKPIRKLEDFKGLKVRAIQETAGLMKELGAAPGYVPGGEVYMALKLGTFDAATYSIDAIRGFKWNEVIDYYIMPHWCDWYFGDVIVNKAAWDKLPDDLKKVLDEAMVNFGKANKEVYEKELEVVINQASELGYEVLTLSDEDTAKIRQIAIERVWPTVAEKSPECAKAVEAIKAYQGVK